MPSTGIINIIGSIGSDGLADVSLRTVMEQVKNLGAVDQYDVIINSGGGEVTEGFAIYQYLTSLNKPITTRGVGLVASIATVIFMSGDKRQLYNNTQFLIHNPWSFGEGDADTLIKKADELRNIENQLIDFYVNVTTGDREVLQSLMREDKFIPAETAYELKFATEILDTIKAYATVNYNKKNKNVMSKIGKIFKDAFSALKAHGVVFNEKVMTTDGMELEITMQGESIAIGDTVTVEGENAEGVYTLADGTVITVVGGAITEMEKPTASVENNVYDATKADMQKKIEELENQLKNLIAENTELKNEQTAMVKEVEVITNHLRNLKVNVNIPNAKLNLSKKTEVNTEVSKDDIKARIKELQNKSKKKTTIAI